MNIYQWVEGPGARVFVNSGRGNKLFTERIGSVVIPRDEELSRPGSRPL